VPRTACLTLQVASGNLFDANGGRDPSPLAPGGAWETVGTAKPWFSGGSLRGAYIPCGATAIGVPRRSIRRASPEREYASGFKTEFFIVAPPSAVPQRYTSTSSAPQHFLPKVKNRILRDGPGDLPILKTPEAYAALFARARTPLRVVKHPLLSCSRRSPPPTIRGSIPDARSSPCSEIRRHGAFAALATALCLGENRQRFEVAWRLQGRRGQGWTCQGVPRIHSCCSMRRSVVRGPSRSLLSIFPPEAGESDPVRRLAASAQTVYDEVIEFLTCRTTTP